MPSNVLFPPSFREIRKQKKNLLSVLVVENIGDHWRPVLWHRGENLRQSKSEPNKIWGDFSHSRSGRQSIGSEQNEQPGVRDVWSDRYIALFKAFCIHPDGYSPNPMANWKEKKKKGKKKKKFFCQYSNFWTNFIVNQCYGYFTCVRVVWLLFESGPFSVRRHSLLFRLLPCHTRPLWCCVFLLKELKIITKK